MVSVAKVQISVVVGSKEIGCGGTVCDGAPRMVAPDLIQVLIDENGAAQSNWCETFNYEMW